MQYKPAHCANKMLFHYRSLNFAAFVHIGRPAKTTEVGDFRFLSKAAQTPRVASR